MSIYLFATFKWRRPLGGLQQIAAAAIQSYVDARIRLFIWHKSRESFFPDIFQCESNEVPFLKWMYGVFFWSWICLLGLKIGRCLTDWRTIYWMCYFLMIPFVVLSIFREMPETKINLSTWWTLIRIHSSKIAVLCFLGGRISRRNSNMEMLEQIVHISIFFGNAYFKLILKDINQNNCSPANPIKFLKMSSENDATLKY